MTSNIDTKDMKKWLAEGKKVFDTEIQAMQIMRDALDDTFLAILDAIVNCTGKVVVTGMGKPGHIATKIAATFASLGTQAFFVHPGEAMHGDLGMIASNDIVIAISYSGESDEVIRILPNIKMIGASLIAITGNAESTLAKASDICQVLPYFKEACHIGLAPTSSTTVALAYGDALAVVASEIYGFKDVDFGKFHPAGSLGKKLVLKVRDLMSSGDANPSVGLDTLLMKAITVMSNKGLGVVSVVDDNNKLVGIITDGDLRRIIESKVDIYTVKVRDVMTISPKNITPDKLAIDAMRYIKQTNVNNLPVVDENMHLIGTITWQQIAKAGLVLQ